MPKRTRTSGQAASLGPEVSGWTFDYATNWDRNIVPATSDILCWSNVVPGNSCSWRLQERRGSQWLWRQWLRNIFELRSDWQCDDLFDQHHSIFHRVCLGSSILIDSRRRGVHHRRVLNGLSTTVGLLNIVGRNSGIVHQLYNNSTNTATLTPGIEWTSGGGVAYTLDFGGTGNWQANNYLNNNNSANTVITMDGPGTLLLESTRA